ncbi:MAG: ribonuclease III [Anaerovorax sp.]
MNSREFESIIEYEFKDRGLLENALTHSSYVNEKAWLKSNERAEFLGDAIFDVIISEYLYKKFENLEEGKLTKMRATIVCESSLANCGRKLGVQNYLKLGKGEELTGGRQRNSIIADAMEAVIGAIYLDGGLEAARVFVLKTFEKLLKSVNTEKLNFDYKTHLQEVLQKNGEVDISYVLDHEVGPDHEKTFYVNLFFNGSLIGQGSGKSKKSAEQKAAKKALEGGL